MTRENKLALVIGFALILLVGILVSDHFSTARHQQSAHLARTIEPLSRTRWENPDLIALPQESRTAQRLQEQTEGSSDPTDGEAGSWPRSQYEPEVIDPMASAARGSIEMGASPIVDLGASEAAALPYRFHDVRPGESLSTICRQHYGDGSLAEELARYNGITDPDTVRSGHRLRIPAAGDLVRGRRRADGARSATEESRVAAPTRTYTVRKNDSLSGIAHKLLGSARKYRLIYEHNRHLLTSPDDLRPGMVLTIPEEKR